MTAVLPDVGTIEHLDFTPEIPCESRTEGCEDDHAADWYVESHCRGPVPVCNAAIEYARKWLSVSAFLGTCTTCGVTTLRTITILGPVR